MNARLAFCRLKYLQEQAGWFVNGLDATCQPALMRDCPAIALY